MSQLDRHRWRRRAFLTGGTWIFDAPPARAITKPRDLALRRTDCVTEPTTLQSNDGDRAIRGRSSPATATHSSSEASSARRCADASSAPSACSFGADSSIAPPRAPIYAVNTARISYTVVRATRALRSCPTGAAVEHADPTRQGLSAPASRSPTQSADAEGRRCAARGRLAPAERPRHLRRGRHTGIRAVGSSIARRTQRDARPCDYHLPAPCSGVNARSIGRAAGVPDGTHVGRDRRHGRRRQRDVRAAHDPSSTAPRRRPARARPAAARSCCRSPTPRPASPARRSRSGTSRPSPTGRSTPRSRTGGSPPGSTAAAPRASTCASRSATRRATSRRAPPPVSRPRARSSADAPARCAPAASRCPSAAPRGSAGA